MRKITMWVLAYCAFFAPSLANAGLGQPSPWQIGFQESASEVMDFIHSFHNGLLILITAITLFVLFLLLFVMLRFREKANPVPSKTTHHVGLEIAWTLVPVLILVVIAVPSFRSLKQQLVIPVSDVTIKATGHAWYWTYEYPKDQGGFSFESNMVSDGQLKSGQPRLLSVDHELVLPVNKVIRLQVTAADVLHAFALPSFGLKIDAVPGRMNETWFKANKEGMFYGQCSELCGQNHAYMPIAIRIVSEEVYKVWLDQAKVKYASTGEAQEPVFLAAIRPLPGR